MSDNSILNFNDVTNIIKDAIIRSRYQAAKLVNKELLSLYYAVGRYVSQNSRNDFWGQGAIKQLSEALQRELPGLRGFSEGAIKKMRLFYEEWQSVFSNRSLTTNDLKIEKISTESSLTTMAFPNNTDISVDLSLLAKHINLCALPEFSAEEFYRVGFTHHYYTKPMGVATYRTRNEMPDEWQKALPDFEDMKKLLESAPDEQITEVE